ncbi:FMN-binding protein [Microbacterium sp.]|uniref:FMN-binding protein n=1 Tax=Microbacterium sp. TaxID=51671 RepID=UPI003C7661C6
MKKIIFALLTTVSGLVLLLSYRTSLGESASVAVVDAGAADSSAAASPSTATASPSTTTTPTPSATESAATGGTGLADGVFDGDAVQTRYGDVQVQITVSGGQITAVTVPVYPSGNNRDAQISSRAIPQLVSETLSAQSAQIDMVSGATYTSKGYAASLQSAIDAAS